MKFLLKILLIVVMAACLQFFLPWWSAVIASFIIGALFSKNSGFQSFMAGFLAIFILWVGYSLTIDISTQGMLTEKIARIFTINNKYILILITGLIGAIPAGFGALTGNQLQKMFKKERNSGYYS